MKYYVSFSIEILGGMILSFFTKKGFTDCNLGSDEQRFFVRDLFQSDTNETSPAQHTYYTAHSQKGLLYSQDRNIFQRIVWSDRDKW